MSLTHSPLFFRRCGLVLASRFDFGLSFREFCCGVVLFVVCFLCFPSISYAQVTISSISDMDFGLIEFAASHNGSIRLGTNGDVTVTGSGMVSDMSGAAGQVRVLTPNTGLVEVKCSTSGQLFDATATTLTITNIEIAVNTGVAFSSGIACDGTNPADSVVTVLDMDVLSDPDIFLGGDISVSGPLTLPTDKVYSTSGGGTPVTISLVVQ